MAKSLAQLNRQIEKLQREAESLRKKEAGAVISRIKEAIDHYGLTAADLGLAKSGPTGKTAKGRAAGKTPCAAGPRRRRPA